VLSFLGMPLNRYWYVVLLMLGCGVFWEYITPIYREDTTTDVLDLVAYELGGLIYWIISWLSKNKD
jgi:hypothetical protein